MKKYTIKTLLDINNFTGETEGRVLPYVKWILVGAIPIFTYYSFIAGYIRIKFYIIPIFELIWLFRFYLLFVLDEPKRVEQYKKLYAGDYTPPGDIIACDPTDEGFLEYNNGLCSYFIAVTNGYNNDDLIRSKQVEKFLDSLGKFTVIDMYVQSMSIADVIRNKIENSDVFMEKEMLETYIAIMKCNMDIAENSSTLTRTIFEVRGRLNDYKLLKDIIVKALNGNTVKIYRDAQLADKDLIEEIISRDIDTYLDFNNLNTNKYATGKYHGSRVLAYDDATVVEEHTVEKVEEECDVRRHLIE